MISSTIIPQLLSYTRERGLRGAINDGGWDIDFVEVEDKGVLLKLNSVENYKRILEYERMHKEPLRHLVQLQLGRSEIFFGPGILQFLELVQYTGSMHTACRMMHISYSKVLKMVALAEKELGFPLLARQVGGIDGGFSQLTEKGAEFVNDYMSMQKELDTLTDELFQKYILSKYN